MATLFIPSVSPGQHVHTIAFPFPSHAGFTSSQEKSSFYFSTISKLTYTMHFFLSLSLIIHFAWKSKKNKQAKGLREKLKTTKYKCLDSDLIVWLQIPAERWQQKVLHIIIMTYLLWVCKLYWKTMLTNLYFSNLYIGIVYDWGNTFVMMLLSLNAQ